MQQCSFINIHRILYYTITIALFISEEHRNDSEEHKKKPRMYVFNAHVNAY